MAQIIKADGSIVEVKILDGQDELTLQQLQEAVEGHIEMAPIMNPVFRAAGKIMFCNEDGMMLNKPLNKLASGIAGQRILGNVILCDQGEVS